MAEVALIVDDLELLLGISRCRICHEEEFESSSSMEAPCACSGTVKFAHRDCIQRWCNEKGNIICEICLQQYEPGYTAPPKKSKIDDEAMSISKNRQTREEIVEEGVVIESDDSECHSAADRNASCCRTLAIVLTLLLLVKHILFSDGTEGYPFSILTVIILKASGIVIPMYIIIRTIGAIQNGIKHNYQNYYYDTSISNADEENESLYSSRHV